MLGQRLVTPLGRRCSATTGRMSAETAAFLLLLPLLKSFSTLLQAILFLVTDREQYRPATLIHTGRICWAVLFTISALVRGHARSTLGSQA